MNTYSITLKKIRSNVGLELSVNEKKLNYFDEHPITGINIRDFGDKQVIEINTDLIKKADVHIFTKELSETIDRAGDSVIEIRNGNMLIERALVSKLGCGCGYRVFCVNNDNFSIKTAEY